MTNRVGQHLGNYHLVRLLGRGGQAEVYLGEHRYLHSHAALKVLHVSLDDKHVELFLAEAQTLARLAHPSIVRILDFTVEQGTPVLIMDYSPKGTMRQRYPLGTCVPVATVVSAVSQVASALHYAHTHHVIHRDVKPDNLLLGPRDEVLLSDFGLSVFAPSPELLSTQEMAGTLPYMAPEQLQGHPCFASDQYSLAIVAYEWLTGRRPFIGPQWQLIQQHLEAAPPPLRELNPSVSEAVEAVVRRALAKDPGERYGSVQGFAQALLRASQQEAAPREESQQILPLPSLSSLAESPSSLLTSSSPPLNVTPPTFTQTVALTRRAPAPSSQEQARTQQMSPASSPHQQDRARLFEAPGEVPLIGDHPTVHQISLRRENAARPPSRPDHLWNAPHRNPFFTGREDLLNQLHAHFSRAPRDACIHSQALTGLGGIGKTQVALEYACRYRDEYRSVHWVNAASHETLVAGFVTMARKLALPAKDEQDQHLIVEAVHHWLATHEQWLLILDNIEDLDLAEEFLPTTAAGHILLTTRVAATGFTIQSMAVQQMNEPEGALFLLRRAKILKTSGASLWEASRSDQMAAAALVRELGGLPLALDQAGAYVEETQCRLAAYLSAYQKRRDELLKRRGGARKDHPDPVATTWSLNFEQVEHHSPLAAHLLQFLAFLAPDAIPEELILAGASQLGPQLQALAEDETLLDEAIGILRRFSLVHRHPETHVLRIHRLVQAVLRATMTDTTQHEWAERTVRAVNLAFPDAADVKVWPQCERALPHALVCATLIEDSRLACAQASHLLYRTADYLDSRAHYTQAEPLYQRALAIRQQQLGPKHPDTAQSLNGLATFYREQGKYEQAEPLYQRALAIRQQQLGPEHPDTATSLNGLAALYREQGKYEQAEPLYQRALAIRQQQLGPEHPDTARCLHHLAFLYTRQGKYEQAEPLCQRALAIVEKQLGPEHPHTALALVQLAGLYYRQGKDKQAEPLLQQALAIREQQWGPEHPLTPWYLTQLGSLYQAQGQYEQAEPLLQRALAIREQALGPDHPWTAYSLDRLATLYREQDKYQQAELLYQQALAIREQRLGPEHPGVASALSGLANLYREQGKYQQAELLYQRALTIRQQQRGAQHPETAKTLHDLARFYELRNQSDKALALYQQALAIREQQLGSEHPRTVETRTAYAHLRRACGRSEEAAALEATSTQQATTSDQESS